MVAPGRQIICGNDTDGYTKDVEAAHRVSNSVSMRLYFNVLLYHLKLTLGTGILGS